MLELCLEVLEPCSVKIVGGVEALTPLLVPYGPHCALGKEFGGDIGSFERQSNIKAPYVFNTCVSCMIVC